MIPSQVIAERGSDVVVINPGSMNLRFGLASSQVPSVINHVIAWHNIKSQTDREIAGKNLKGAVGEEKFGRCSLTAARRMEREEALQLIESQLRVHPLSKDDGRSGQRKVNGLENFSTDPEDLFFTWTEVEMEGGWKSSDFESSYCEHAMNGDSPLRTTSTMRHESHMFRRFVCGDEALRIPSTQAYSLRRPICRGRLNVSDHYSLQQVCDDMCILWDWALTTHLGLDAKRREQFSIVLVVPDTLDSREIKEMLTVLLRELHFNSAVIHQESIAVTFGNGVPSGCIVNIGAQVTTVICVEDGVALPSTRVTLPFGGEDISRCLLWLEQRLRTWPPVECDPLSNPLDMFMLNKVKEAHCRIKEGDHRAAVELHFHSVGTLSQQYRVTLSELNVPPMGLFIPALLTPEEYVPLTRPWYHTDCDENTLDDAIHAETGRRSEALEAGLVVGNHAGASENMENSSHLAAGEFGGRNEEGMMGISQAIVNSILSIGRMDLQKKLFSSIQLVGGTASTPGLIDAVEERVLQAIPLHESIDTVEVLPHRIETSIVAWKGGAILAILDFARDTWVQREDWTEGGVRVGAGRKYKDSLFLQTHVFWYTSS